MSSKNTQAITLPSSTISSVVRGSTFAEHPKQSETVRDIVWVDGILFLRSPTTSTPFSDWNQFSGLENHVKYSVLIRMCVFLLRRHKIKSPHTWRWICACTDIQLKSTNTQMFLWGQIQPQHNSTKLELHKEHIWPVVLKVPIYSWIAGSNTTVVTHRRSMVGKGRYIYKEKRLGYWP